MLQKTVVKLANDTLHRFHF